MRYLSFASSLAIAAAIATNPASAQTAQPGPLVPVPVQTPTIGQPAAEQPAIQLPGAGASSAAQPSADAQGLSDIIVTAQRRSESSQRAAIAIDVVTPQALQSAGVVTPATLNAAVPSLSVQQGGGANTAFFVRGVGNYTSNGYSDSAVAFNLDGVYLGRPTSTTGAFFDLERVEVLKGPQGTLYGRNATGGAINVIPAKPKLDTNSLSIAGSFGNYKAVDAEAAVNLAIGSDAAIRISAKVVDRDGYNEDGTSDENGQAIRAQLLVEPSSTLTLRVSADYSHQGGLGIGYSYLGSEAYTPGTVANAASPANYTFTPVPANLGPYSGLLSAAGSAYFSKVVIPGASINPAPLAQPYNDNSYWGVTGEVNLETPIGALTIVPAYRHSDIDNLSNGPSFRAFQPLEKDSQYSVEARLQGKRVGPVDWLVGLYYFNETVDGLYALNQYQIDSFQNFKSKTKSYAAFGRLTLHLSDRLRLVGGGRYTKDDKDFLGTANTLVEICAAPTCIGGPSIPVVGTLAQVPGGPTLPFTPVPFGTAGNLLLYVPNTVNASIDKGRFTYRAAAEFDLAQRSLLYASYETGYRSGGFSLAPGYETFLPEYVDAWTIGSKNRFFDNKVQLNLEAFYWKYRDQQVSHFGTDATGNANFFTQNIGRSTIKGVELDAEWLVTPTTKLGGTVEYLDAKVDSYSFDNPRGGTNLPPVTGCGVTSTTAAGAPVYQIDCAGKDAYNSPRWSLNGAIDQTIPLGLDKVVLSGEARYRSNSVIGFEYLPQQNSGDNWTFDASATFGSADDRWSITGFVHNITDRTVASYAQLAGTVGNILSSAYSPPRTYGVRGAVRF